MAPFPSENGVEADGEREEEEEEEEEEEDDPRLKNQRIGGSIQTLLASDAATRIAVAERMIAHDGTVYILDFLGNQNFDLNYLRFSVLRSRRGHRALALTIAPFPSENGVEADDEREEEEEEEEDEPRLTVAERMIALDTHDGTVHILDFLGNQVARLMMLDSKLAVPLLNASKECDSRYFLHLHLHSLFVLNPQAGRDFHGMQVELYVDYDPKMLLPFLRSSQHYTLEKVYRLNTNMAMVMKRKTTMP